MQHKMNYAYDFQSSTLVNRPAPPKAFKGFTHQRPRQQQPRPFDPEELSRRLYLVIAEQKAQAEKRRRFKADAARSGTSSRRPVNVEEKARRRTSAKAERPSKHDDRPHPPRIDSNGSDRSFVERAKRASSKKAKDTDTTGFFDSDGHYIPQVAASQFARTTLGDIVSEPDKGLIHKLSRKAVKYHMQGPTAAREVTDAPPCEQAKALRRAQSTRERNYERNQFQHPTSLLPLDEAAVFDAPVIDEKQMKASRRKSTGSFLGKSDPVRHSAEYPPIMTILEKQPTYDHCEVIGNPDEHRVDWSQSDEANRHSRPESPVVRKQDSRWPLRVRLGSFNKHAKDEKATLPASGADENGVAVVESPTSPKSPKSPKSGFFARFKR
ncbi:hypothetical protein K4F52_005101 [Lecanicillium sp. MT-2017a]|nr:hypothetical protein K4F52_005101 [Lecanicillium sp. MT-2017a]